MKTIIKVSVPMVQKIDITSTYDKEWDTHLVNIYSEESYPDQPDREPIGEEVTLAFNTKNDLDRFIELLHKATKKIK
jgi:hypothetical protein